MSSSNQFKKTFYYLKLVINVLRSEKNMDLMINKYKIIYNIVSNRNKYCML